MRSTITCGDNLIFKSVPSEYQNFMTWVPDGALDNYLVINGRARITEGGAPELLNQLAQIYVGPGTTFIPDGAPAGYITHITAEHIHGIGPWDERH